MGARKNFGQKLIFSPFSDVCCACCVHILWVGHYVSKSSYIDPQHVFVPACNANELKSYGSLK